MTKKIALGTWSWGNQLLWKYNPTSDEELFKTYQEALKSGFILIDTADSYGTGQFSGRSEKLLGSFYKMVPKGQTNKIKIVTKLAPYPWRLGRNGFTGPFLNSFQRLNKKVDIVQLHWSTAKYNPFQEIQLLNNLCDLIDRGYDFCIGLSNIGPNRLRQIIKFLSERNQKIKSVQVQFSLLAPDLEKQAKVKQICEINNIDFLGYSPLAFGILCKDPNHIKEIKGFNLRNLILKTYEKPTLQLRKCIHEIAISRSVSMAQVAINWSCYQGVIPIIGLRKTSQVKDASGVLSWDLTQSEFEELEDASKKLNRRMPSNPFSSN